MVGKLIELYWDGEDTWFVAEVSSCGRTRVLPLTDGLLILLLVYCLSTALLVYYVHQVTLVYCLSTALPLCTPGA